MGTCANCKYAGRPTYKSPCSECKGYSKHEAVEIRTNADRIRAMSDEELAKFLKSLVFGRETPWADPFARNFCDKCLPIKAMGQETGKEIEFYECECWDGKCPNGDDVTWWLKQPVEGCLRVTFKRQGTIPHPENPQCIVVEEIKFGGEMWYPLLVEFGYFPDAENRDPALCGRDMVLSHRQGERLRSFTLDRDRMRDLSELCRLVLTAQTYKQDIVINADWRGCEINVE